MCPYKTTDTYLRHTSTTGCICPLRRNQNQNSHSYRRTHRATEIRKSGCTRPHICTRGNEDMSKLSICSGKEFGECFRSICSIHATWAKITRLYGFHLLCVLSPSVLAQQHLKILLKSTHSIHHHHHRSRDFHCCSQSVSGAASHSRCFTLGYQ